MQLELHIVMEFASRLTICTKAVVNRLYFAVEVVAANGHLMDALLRKQAGIVEATFDELAELALLQSLAGKMFFEAAKSGSDGRELVVAS